jgi:hypothetical protein
MSHDLVEDLRAAPTKQSMTSASTSLARLAQELQKPEPEIMTLAFEAGLRQLWREHILGQYLRGKISRDKASESVGIDWVELAEQQHATMSEDLAWAWGD